MAVLDNLHTIHLKVVSNSIIAVVTGSANSCRIGLKPETACLYKFQLQ